MMLRRVLVSPLRDPLGSTGRYDILIACVGFEERARYVAANIKAQATLRLASAFTYNRVLSFGKNLEWYGDNGFDVKEHTDQAFREWIPPLLNDPLREPGVPLKVAVDISSMTRDRIATVVAAAVRCSRTSTVRIDFLYAMAKYPDPPTDLAPIARTAPVLPEFASHPADPGIPSSCIIGLGYEPGKALGAYEFLEPGETWFFVPVGEDVRYEKGVREANRILLDASPRERVIEYGVQYPYETFLKLESLTAGLLMESRPALLPLGPKMFSLCAMLVAARHAPRVSVWRVTAGEYEPQAERLPSSTVVGLAAEFVPTGNGDESSVSL